MRVFLARRDELTQIYCSLRDDSWVSAAGYLWDDKEFDTPDALASLIYFLRMPTFTIYKARNLSLVLHGACSRALFKKTRIILINDIKCRC